MRIAVIAPAALFAAVTAFGGVVYDYKTVIASIDTTTYTGTMTIDGAHVRMAVQRGDHSLYKDGFVVLSSDGGKTQQVLDPATKTYFELSVTELIDFFKRLPTKPDFRSPKVSRHEDGDGGTIEGMPTRKVGYDISGTMTMHVMNRDLSTPVEMTFEAWMTDRIDVGPRQAMLANNMRTGIEMIDKMIESSPAFVSGFPMKTQLIQRMTIDGRDLVTTMISTVSNVQQHAVDDALFQLPSEYRKVPNPLAGFLKELDGK